MFSDNLIGNEFVCSLCRYLLIVTLLLNAKSVFRYYPNGKKSGTGFIFLFVVMMVYCVYYCPSAGDNYGSMASYYSYLEGADWERLHFERVYFSLMDIAPWGYVYYRYLVWGTACLLCVWLFKRMRINSSIATVSVLTFALPILLYYQRAAFAYVLLYVSLWCFLTKGEFFESIPFLKKNYRVASALMLFSCTFFHTSMPVYVLFLLVSVFVPKNTKSLVLLAIALGVFSIAMVSNSIYFLTFFSEDTIETGMRSLEVRNVMIGQNFNGMLGDFLHALPIRVMAIYSVYVMLMRPEHHSQFEKACLINTCILLLISAMFSSFSITIQDKFFNAAMMPWTLYIASYYNRNVGSKVCTYYAIATVFTFFI